MRPRPDAAENLAGQAGPASGLLASMRPRPDAAENAAVAPVNDRLKALGFNEAAARCRGKLRLPPRHPGGTPKASMRPRPDAAENVHENGRTSALGRLQ